MWFGTSEPDDSKGALPYDTYIIEEMRCDSNKGFELIPPFEIVVSRNNLVIDLGTLTDEYEKEISIHTTATSKDGEKTNVYNTYYPMFTIMIGTGLRCGELIGLTWKDINIKAKTVNVDHQLIYKNLGDGCKFHISTPKTSSGIRIIPMTQEVAKAFEEQRKINFMLAKDKSIEVDGCSGFVFTAKSGRPLMPNGVNSVLYNIVDAYNKTEVERAKKEHRKAELLPKFSAHVMRHTACTRMAECRMDVKVLQYIMGHAHIDVTMEVYNHIGELTRIENEIARLDSMVLNA